MAEKYIRVRLYMGKTSGFQQKESQLAGVEVVTPNDIEPLGRGLTPVEAVTLANRWGEMIGFPVRKFVEKRVTTSHYEEVAEGSCCPLCGGSGVMGPHQACLCQY